MPGFDHLQRLVEHRGAVDRDLQAHRPVRVGACGFHRHVSHVTQRGGAERAARRRQDDALDRVALVLFQHLENGVVLAVDRKQLAAAFADRCDEQVAGRYQAFLVGKGDIGAAACGGKRRCQPAVPTIAAITQSASRSAASISPDFPEATAMPVPESALFSDS